MRPPRWHCYCGQVETARVTTDPNLPTEALANSWSRRDDEGVTHVRGRVWRAGKPQDDFDFPSISDYLAEEDALVWCDIYDPDHAILKDLAEELSLNTWAVEDTIAESERTKAVVYRSHTFFTVYGVTTKEPANETESMLDIHRISGFVLPRGLITVRLSPHFDIEAVSQRFDELGGQEHGVGSLVHGLLDFVVDGHFEAVQQLDDGIESIEDDLSRTIREVACSAIHFGCARTSSSCDGSCCRCGKSSTRFSIGGWTPRPRRSWIHGIPTSTTMCCGCRSGQSRCGTWSQRCSRRICRCRTPG
jgi:hypothetical protein